MKNKLKNILAITLLLLSVQFAKASSHREAPLIASDPLADNCDLYAFRSPTDSNKIVIIATYVPMQSPQGGPNYNSFGEHITKFISIIILQQLETISLIDLHLIK
jgi:hypothetical protein